MRLNALKLRTLQTALIAAVLGCSGGISGPDTIPWDRLTGTIAYSTTCFGSGCHSTLSLLDATHRTVVPVASRNETAFLYLAWTNEGRIGYATFSLADNPAYSSWTISPSGGDPVGIGIPGAVATTWSREGRVASSCIDEQVCVDGQIVGGWVKHNSTLTRPAWDPSGGTLVVTASAPVPPGAVQNGNGLFRTNGAGDSLGVVVSPVDENDFLSEPQFTADGSALVFTREGGGSSTEIWVANANGSGAKILTTGHQDGQASWSPDGRQIAFLRNGDLFVMRSDGGNVQRVLNHVSGSIAWQH